MSEPVPPPLRTPEQIARAKRIFGAILVTFALAGGVLTASEWRSAERPPIERGPLQPPPASTFYVDAGDASIFFVSTWPTSFSGGGSRCVIGDASFACGDGVRVVVHEVAPDGGSLPFSPAGTWLAPAAALAPCCPSGFACGIHQLNPANGVCQ